MKGMFSVLGLLLVVAIVGVLAKRQFSEMSRTSAPEAAPPRQAVPAPTGTPQQQLRQVEQSIQGVMQQTRPMPDEK